MLSTMNNRLASLFSDPFEAVFRENGRDLNENGWRPDAKTPELSIWEDDQHVYVQIDVPGIAGDDLDVTMKNGKLWIRGERKLPHPRENMYYDERCYGRFERFVSFTEAVDPNAIDASLSDGVLSITLPKKPEHQPQKVAINYGGNGSAKKLADGRSKK